MQPAFRIILPASFLPRGLRPFEAQPFLDQTTTLSSAPRHTRPGAPLRAHADAEARTRRGVAERFSIDPIGVLEVELSPLP
jgi:hypothetical protein